MVYVLVALAIGLAIAAVNTEGGLRLFLAGCLALNVVAAVAMWTDDYPYAFKLRTVSGYERALDS